MITKQVFGIKLLNYGDSYSSHVNLL
jgi:hypothetical protein